MELRPEDVRRPLAPLPRFAPTAQAGLDTPVPHLTARAPARAAAAEVDVREYHMPWEYARDVEAHRREGWQVVSMLERRPARDALHYLTLGLADLVRGPERLVTYARAGARITGRAAV